MKKFIVLSLLATTTLSGCGALMTNVPPGYVGVEVNLYGSDKGVDTKVLPTGRYWIDWSHQLYLFPTFMQNYTFTRDPNEGSPTNEEMTFQSMQGLSVSTDIGISYQIDSTKVALIFQKYHKGVDEITHTYLRNMIRSALVNDASTMSIDQIYGEGKRKLLQQVQSDVQAQVKPLGINIDKIYWIGQMRLPQQVVDGINAKINATQQAQQAENEVARAQAEAQKKIAEAKGFADSTYLQAQAQAKSTLVQAEAQAKANQILAKSITPELIQYQYSQKWNGVLPQFTGSGALPLVNFNQPTTPAGK